MAEEALQSIDIKENKKRLKEERKKLKEQQKKQKKEAKARAKELALEEAALPDESEGSPFSVVIVTLIIVLIWIGILCLLIKLDVGGFGSNVMEPVLRNVPVLNKILPDSVREQANESGYEGYANIQEAVDQIKMLQLQLEAANSENGADKSTIEQLEAEIRRLKTFEENQVEFQKIKNEFYESVVYAENGPGPDEYVKYYESMDEATAQSLYKEVVREQQETKEVKDYAAAYSEMKPKEAAKIFESMTDNLDLVARILGVMSSEDRGKILGVMDPDVAARITKIMDPQS